MPPKKNQKESKKTEQKRKDKVIEDKTFGLKNKKGNKQQKYVQQVNQQVKSAGDPKAKRLEQQRLDEKKRKEEERKKKEEIDGLFKPVLVQAKVAKGVDPKSVLCVFFKSGMCQKGDKCKFSHDLAVERKGEKRSIYADARDEDLEKDTMDTWDEEKLKEVVEKKHGAGNSQKTKTDIVCKFFIQALEDKKYGWFWACPNGTSCKYRHALPPGFVLKSDQKRLEEQEVKISIEDLVEKERAALGSNVTRVTLETFLAWKKRKKAEKVKELNTKKSKRKNDFKTGKLSGVSGREVFEFSPDMVGEDDADADDVKYQREESDDEDGGKVRGVSSNMFVPLEVDENLAKAASNRLKPDPPASDKPPAPHEQQPNGDGTSPSKLAAADQPMTSQPVDDDAVPVDENLFVDDLDDLEDELDSLDM